MDFPKTADIGVIGGGVVGTATAYYLAKSGRKNVVLVEKNTVCSGSTGRCGAGIRAQWGLELNCRMALACLDTFEQLDEELGLPTGLNQAATCSLPTRRRSGSSSRRTSSSSTASASRPRYSPT